MKLNADSSPTKSKILEGVFSTKKIKQITYKEWNRMSPENNNEEQMTRKILKKHPLIEKLKNEFSLSEDAKDAAILFYRILVGLGKGLTSSQKQSFSAISAWFAAKLVDEQEIPKKQLAKFVNVSHRTLSRRFREVSEDEECKKVLNYLKDRIRKWSRKKERKLSEYL
ncbi:hypothetical protein AKJ37_04315 [candidate division MSBL1 archaeon SCGC-AAA259I09]|uniref:Uncharacterized protein n=1 Tax=candidate division MSBL1 archaeon SCGC-AAA259I09 TaxID=1698267 RepID=A0A133URR3_9EURY|nr:hypothetical protein AKJ37_04315 [candidate division MSBL1 archaeon SCGC-AAA259I09]